MKNELHAPSFRPFPINQVRPAGWLKNQLEIQAAGLSGNLDTFWPDIRDSKWIGGKAEGWERMPYWLDGFIPLARLLDDEDKLARARRYIDAMIARQQDDGWICPVESAEERFHYDMWALFLLLKVLVVWHDATGDERVENVVRKALLSLDRHIDMVTLFCWAQTRWFECLIAIYWLYERNHEQWLLDLAVKIRAQGFDWPAFFSRWPMKQPTERGRWSQMNHVVNNAMMLKSPALWWRMTGNADEFKDARSMVDQLDKHHGMVTGVFTGDECLAGTSPVQGTELCAVAEYMYSLQFLAGATGDPTWGDRLERITFNALPATFGPDMWTHQYDQQVNQIECSRQDAPLYLTNGPDSNLFGLEPNYGCCTANLSQAWPKFVQSMFMKSGDGIAIAAWAPALLDTEINGARVRIELKTEYPFREDIEIVLTADKPVSFPLLLRIPGWAEGATLVESTGSSPATGLVTDSNHAAGLAAGSHSVTILAAGTYHTVSRQWAGTTGMRLRFPMQPAVVARPNDLFAVTRGPLVYSLKIGEDWRRVNRDMSGHELPHGDFEVFATTSWNYGLCLDPANPQGSLSFAEKALGDLPFSPEGAPVVCKVKGRKVYWDKVAGSAAPAPSGGVIGSPEDLVLIPYGCTNLRMTEMPLVPWNG